jgi:hypothetical protein
MLVQAGQVKSAAPMQHGLSGDSVRVTEGSGHLSRIHQANAAMPSEVLGGVHWASHGRFHRGLVAGVILFAHADLSSAMKRDNPSADVEFNSAVRFFFEREPQEIATKARRAWFSRVGGLLCVARLGPLGGKRQLGEALSCTANPDRADHR